MMNNENFAASVFNIGQLGSTWNSSSL